MRYRVMTTKKHRVLPTIGIILMFLFISGCQSDGCIIKGCKWAEWTEEEKAKHVSESIKTLTED
jgi:hypothetical protein